MNTKDTLRLNGYSLDSEGRIACRVGKSGQRFEQTWCAVVSIEVARESKDAREIVDALVEAADSPRVIVGRKRDGSAVLLFKCAQKVTDAVGDFGTRDGKVRFTITVKSEGGTLDISDYSWVKERSPLAIERDRLPTLTDEVSKLVTESATGKLRCAPSALVKQWQRSYELNAQLAARVASGEFKIPTAQEQEEAEQERLVDENKGRDVGIWDGNWAAMLIRARQVVAARRKAKAEQADAAA